MVTLGEHEKRLVQMGQATAVQPEQLQDLTAEKYEIIAKLVSLEDEKAVLMIKKLVFGQNWPKLTLEQEVELDMTQRRMLRGEGKSYSWEEVEEYILQKKKK